MMFLFISIVLFFIIDLPCCSSYGGSSFRSHFLSDLTPNENQITPYSQHGSKIALTNLVQTDQSSECALILQRNNAGSLFQTPAPQFNGFLNLFNNPNSYQSKNLNQICIKYSDLSNAIMMAKASRNYRRPYGLNSLEPALTAIETSAELTLQVTKILANQFKLSPDEILNGLPMIDLSKTLLWDECPAHVKPIPCTIERYRSYTGHCNNLKHSNWGAVFTPFVRHLPPVYADGIQAPRVSILDGSQLPSPRLVTSTVHKDIDRSDPELSILLMMFGQFLDHDISLQGSPRDEKGFDFDCCTPPTSNHPNCLPIEIPENDKFYSQFGRRCMDFKRSIAGHRPSCALGPRLHVNLLTSQIDANFVYGSTEQLANRLRAFHGGRMKVWDVFRNYGLKPLLPPESENPDLDCIARPRHLYCFIAGDERVNEQIHLAVLHTIFMREHNRIATILSELNPHWNDEKLYQETRHILAATVQHITINEFLPLLLGKDICERYNLTVTDGYWNGYDENVHIGPAHGFQVAAYRFGHTFIQSFIRRYNKNHEFIGEEALHHFLKQPYVLYEPGKMDEFIGGLLNTPVQTFDPYISKEISNHLFQAPHEHFGLDLPALNLARGREHGVPGYNFYREWCGLGRARTFEELAPILQNDTAYLYSTLYKHVDDIDLWSAGISEKKLPGAVIGPTFACLIARQFSNLRKGDRFWYENPNLPSSFTPDQLFEIKKSTLAKIVCENSDNMPTTQLWVMRLTNENNPRYRCKDIPSIDLSFWKEDTYNGFAYRRK